ncbi:MAG: ferrous iron transport protein B [Ruminococcaceae bacterium]|nr:ferrous iron transport protein B [Oscillospiraceae bacterium]
MTAPRRILLVGNPNVGKSTLFNALTGLHQHTGNWPGKTVSQAQGTYRHRGQTYRLVDTPGTYSLLARSPDEEVTRDALCAADAAAVVVVCDATCLSRNLNLALQVMEIGLPTVVCVNLLDEARRRRIYPDLLRLEKQLGVPVVGTIAKKKRTLTRLRDTVARVCDTPPSVPSYIRYDTAIENAVAALRSHLPPRTVPTPRYVALRLLEGDDRYRDAVPARIVEDACKHLRQQGITEDGWRDRLVAGVIRRADTVSAGVVKQQPGHDPDRRIDRVLTGRLTAYPMMILLLLLLFYITIEGANAPSQWLTALFARGEQGLTALCRTLAVPDWLHGALVLGVYRVLAWVVAVMLPPMAIFFPLFTLLEDVGYLPRIAYNLDRPFRRCRACGKQALTMCMGFGCNAVGVTGCRIIDSPRERLLAILTNSLVPCNGRFPTLITLLTLFFVGTAGGWGAAALLTLFILLGIGATLGVTWLLSVTLLRGAPSAFTLELPSYRRPQVGQVLVRSVLDRTLFVLGRAAAVAAPAGLILWLTANITVAGTSLLQYGAAFLDPFARLMGLDGVILIAFILGFPANEIVVPIILMAYLATGTLTDISDLDALRQILVANGWTARTALCTVLFSLFHWPCSTTLLTIRKETGRWRWVAAAALIPTLLGIVTCMLVNALWV